MLKPTRPCPHEDKIFAFDWHRFVYDFLVHTIFFCHCEIEMVNPAQSESIRANLTTPRSRQAPQSRETSPGRASTHIFISSPAGRASRVPAASPGSDGCPRQFGRTAHGRASELVACPDGADHGDHFLAALWLATPSMAARMASWSPRYRPDIGANDCPSPSPAHTPQHAPAVNRKRLPRRPVPSVGRRMTKRTAVVGGAPADCGMRRGRGQGRRGGGRAWACLIGRRSSSSS